GLHRRGRHFLMDRPPLSHLPHLVAPGPEAVPGGGSMRDYLRPLGVFFRMSFPDAAAYRGEFWMRLLATLYALAAAVVGPWILFPNAAAIAGWNIYEVLILIGTFHVVGGVSRAVFAPNFQRITDEVREGTLDFVLTKPANSQFLASFRRIVAAAGLESVMGLLIIGYGISQLPEGSNLYTAFAFAFALGCGLAVL